MKTKKMKFNTNNPFVEEILPWDEYIPENATKIILGTFPTIKENRDFDFISQIVRINFGKFYLVLPILN